MRIGIYARVSTKDQSCELQIRDLRAYCAARRLDLVREYVDVGQSGAKDSRPELNKLMDEARKRSVATKRRLMRANKRAANGKRPYFRGDEKIEQHTLWAWCDTKFATLADVWPGARP